MTAKGSFVRANAGTNFKGNANVADPGSTLIISDCARRCAAAQIDRIAPLEYT